MTYAFTQDVPINRDFYQVINDRLGAEVPDGLVVHVVIERPEGGLRYIDVWESEGHWQRFVEDRLHPIIHELLRPIFGDELPPEPEQTSLSIVQVWKP